MNLSYVVLALILVISLYLAFKPTYSYSKNLYEGENIPVTWNYDWQGGPGYDRFVIMNEEGPYNQI